MRRGGGEIYSTRTGPTNEHRANRRCARVTRHEGKRKEIAEVTVPQVVDQFVALISAVPVLQNLKEIVEVASLALQERVRRRVAEHLVAVPGRTNSKDIFAAVSWVSRV